MDEHVELRTCSHAWGFTVLTSLAAAVYAGVEFYLKEDVAWLWSIAAALFMTVLFLPAFLVTRYQLRRLQHPRRRNPRLAEDRMGALLQETGGGSV